MVEWRVLKWFRNRFAKYFFFNSTYINFDKVYHITLPKKSSSTFAFHDFYQSLSTWWNTKKLSTLATTQSSKGLPEFQLLTKKIKKMEVFIYHLDDYNCETVNSRLIQKNPLTPFFNYRNPIILLILAFHIIVFTWSIMLPNILLGNILKIPQNKFLTSTFESSRLSKYV